MIPDGLADETIMFVQSPQEIYDGCRTAVKPRATFVIRFCSDPSQTVIAQQPSTNDRLSD
jgi:hypothetical protein